MRQLFHWMLALAAGAFVFRSVAQPFSVSGGLPMPTKNWVTLLFLADGSCQVTNETIVPRQFVEQQLRAWEQSQKRSGGAEDDDGTSESATQETAAGPHADEVLAEKIRQQKQQSAEEMDSEAELRIVLLDVQTNTVRTVTIRRFASIEELLRKAHPPWEEAGLMFENVRMEEDTNGLLRVTFSPLSGLRLNAKNMIQQWKRNSVTNEFKLVFPGKVLTSGLPHTQAQATWITFAAQQNETSEAMLKLYDAPTVITAELGGLKLDQPQESKTLRRQVRREVNPWPELPITDAGPGFLVEPTSVTTSVVYLFSEGEKSFKQGRALSLQPTGTIVYAKLYAPQDRTLLSVGSVRVHQATDDKGRAIAATDQGEDLSNLNYQTGLPWQTKSVQLQFRLPLPQPDAQSIETVSAEAVVVTAGTWKKLTLTGLKENPQAELDLSAVLPGAKMIITKFSAKNRQLQIQAQFKGPATIRQLQIECTGPSRRQFNAAVNERQFIAKGDQSTRSFMIQGYLQNVGVDEESDFGSDSLALVIRYPQDLRRERVQFTLKALDLL